MYIYMKVYLGKLAGTNLPFHITYGVYVHIYVMCMCTLCTDTLHIVLKGQASKAQDRTGEGEKFKNKDKNKNKKRIYNFIHSRDKGGWGGFVCRGLPD